MADHYRATPDLIVKWVLSGSKHRNVVADEWFPSMKEKQRALDILSIGNAAYPRGQGTATAESLADLPRSHLVHLNLREELIINVRPNHHSSHRTLVGHPHALGLQLCI